MRLKQIWLASTALATLLSTGHAQAGDFYVSILGGANFQTDNSGAGSTTSILGFPFSITATNTATFSQNSDTGFMLGGAIGVHVDNWVKGLRTEVEASYRRNDVGGEWRTSNFFDGKSSGVIDANRSTFAVMANVAYDIDVGSKVQPYVMAGGGWARLHLNGVFAASGPQFDEQASGFAWQLGAGFNYPVADGVSVGVGYRYFRGPKFDPVFLGKNDLPVQFDNENHTIAVNLTIETN